MVAVGVLIAVPSHPPTAGRAHADRIAHAERSARAELATAIDVYRTDHGALPGRIVGASFSQQPTGERLARQLTLATDETGNVAPSSEPSYPFGPYLPNGVPVNPVNGLAGIRLADLLETADGSTGWTVDPATGHVASNALPGEDVERAETPR